MRDTKKQSTKPKPFLKWVGGKGQLLKQFQDIYPSKYGTFYEPFVGGGAVFFNLRPKKAHINDTNKTLINAYIHIRDDAERVIHDLSLIDKKYKALQTEELRKEFFYSMRERFNSVGVNENEKTSLLIFLNRTCFNGLYRENSKGGFNVPFGKYKNPRILDTENLLTVSLALKKTKITCLSFESSVAEAKPGDFIYFDPPYHPINSTSNFTSYNKDDFSSVDQKKLRDCFKQLSDKGCLVMLSNSDTELIHELYKGFNIRTVHAGRAINSKASKRGKIKEVVVTNY